MHKTIGDKLRDLRINVLKIRQIELAEVLDVDRSYISKIESNRMQPGRELLMRISKEFNLSLDWLASVPDNQENNTSLIAQNQNEELLLTSYRNMTSDKAEMFLKLMIDASNTKK